MRRSGALAALLLATALAGFVDAGRRSPPSQATKALIKLGLHFPCARRLTAENSDGGTEVDAGYFGGQGDLREDAVGAARKAAMLGASTPMNENRGAGFAEFSGGVEREMALADPPTALFLHADFPLSNSNGVLRDALDAAKGAQFPPRLAQFAMQRQARDIKKSD